MMTNLFSSFDPISFKNLSLNWLSSALVVMMITTPFWFIPSKMETVIKIVIFMLSKEFKIIVKNQSILIPLSMFILIAMNNCMGLMPYIFTSTSHISITLALALPVWLSYMIFGWINKTTHMLSHTIPTGTPPVLMPFMVLIETTSNLIRPITLSVRLAANMMAGHLLITLMSSMCSNLPSKITILIVTIQILLMILESAVSIIQAYVFSILSTLYWSETN